MPLDPARLRHLHPTPDGGAIAQCPICAADGGDRRGVHLRLFPGGAFACVAHPDDREHRRAIWAAAGLRENEASRPPPPVLRRQNEETEWLKAGAIARDRILKSPWTCEEIERDSPSPIPQEPSAQAAAILRLYAPGDIVWIGDLHESGSPRHARHFRPSSEWLQGPMPPGPRISQTTFRKGVVSRCTRTVRRRPFLVVESDTLTLGEQGALLRLLRKTLTLRAVVHTGGRSLHGWFECPAPTLFRHLRHFLVAVGADPALFNPVQPVRMPGWPRSDSGELPRLIFLCPG